MVIAAVDLEAIVALVTAIAAIVVAILQKMGKDREAKVVSSVWTALRTALEMAPVTKEDLTQDDVQGSSSVARFRRAAANSGAPVAAAEFVHGVISTKQRMTPTGAKELAGNGLWNKALGRLLR